MTLKEEIDDALTYFIGRPLSEETIEAVTRVTKHLPSLEGLEPVITVYGSQDQVGLIKVTLQVGITR